MDTFDDLLAPSRQALEDNPFADPFARRSGSPDPWANPFASTPLSTETFGHASSTAEPSLGVETVRPSNDEAPSLAEHHLSDPLDSAVHNQDDEDDNKPLGRLRSPGFRESVPSDFSEIATIRPAEPKESEQGPSTHPASSNGPSTPTPRAETPTWSPPQPTKDHTRQSSRSGSSLISPSSSTSGSSVTSPLEKSSITGLAHSVAALSLGGESLGGWQSEEQQTSWRQEPTSPIVVAPQVNDDDSDDDKPIRQTVKLPQEASPSVSVTKATKNDNGIQPVFIISVEDPQKVGDPIRSFTMYTVHTRTTSPLFQKSAFSVLRRYSDFLWLYETLSNNNPGVVVPPVPEKNSFGRFDDQFVRQRRLALEKCIQKIANHPVLGKDADLRIFLESDSFALDIKHRKAEIAHERGGLIASIGQTITGPRFYETDEWFDRQKGYLDSLESQLRGLVKAIELVAKQRSDLAIATGEFAQTISDLSASDVGKQLSLALSGLADVERKAQDTQSTQSEQDMVTLMATVDEYARLINSVRLAFSSRIRMYHAWKNAENDLLRTKQNHEKNRAQGRIPTERLGYSLSQIAEAERRALESKHEYDHVSKLVKSEVARFEQERIEDFKDSLHAFLEGMISRQKELIAGWENYQHVLLKRVGGGGDTRTA